MNSVFGNIVVIKRNGSDGARFPLTATSCLFGRHENCDIRVQLPSVSDEHCRIDVNADGQVFLTNVSVDAPTLINGTVCPSSCAVDHNDVFTVCERSFRFEFPPNSKFYPGQKSPQRKSPQKTRRKSTPTKILTPKLKPPTPNSASKSKSPKGPSQVSSPKTKTYDKGSGTKRKAAFESGPPSKRKRVSFGPNLSPEQFDKALPPSTPVSKGATPRRRSEPLRSQTPVSLLKRKSIALINTLPITEESPSSRRSKSPMKITSQYKSPAKSPTLTPKNITRTPEKSPVRTPAKSQVRTPAKSPVRTSAKSPVRTPAKSPVSSQAKSPTRSPAKSPARTPAKSPVSTPAKSPARTPQAKSPTRSPAKSPTRSPAKSPTRSPAKSPVRTPAKSPARTPLAKSPARTPQAKSSARSPAAKSPTRTPAKSPVRTPAKSPARTPQAKSPVMTPAKSPTRTPQTKSPARTPAKSPARTPAKSPARTSAKSPTRSPARSPVSPGRTKAKSLVRENAHTPKGLPGYSPSQIVNETQTKSAVKTPTKSQVKTSINSPVRTPATKSAKSPVRGYALSPTRTPEISSTRTSAMSPARTLSNSPATTKIPGKTPKSPARASTNSPSPAKIQAKTPSKSPARRSSIGSAPYKTPSKSPARTSSNSLSPAKIPTKTPSKSPTRTSTNSPASAKIPAKTPSKSPARTSSNSPASAKILTKTPSKSPAKTPSKTLAKTPKSPARISSNSPSPAKIPAKTSPKSPAKATSKSPAKSKVKRLSKTPAKSPARTPATRSPRGSLARSQIQNALSTPKIDVKSPTTTSLDTSLPERLLSKPQRTSEITKSPGMLTNTSSARLSTGNGTKSMSLKISKAAADENSSEYLFGSRAQKPVAIVTPQRSRSSSPVTSTKKNNSKLALEILEDELLDSPQSRKSNLTGLQSANKNANNVLDSTELNEVVALRAVHGKLATPKLSSSSKKSPRKSARKSLLKKTPGKSARKSISKTPKKSNKKKLWSDILKSGIGEVGVARRVAAPKPISTKVIKKSTPKAKTTQKTKIGKTPKTPRAVARALAPSTGHIESPLTLIVGKKVSKKVKTPVPIPKKGRKVSVGKLRKSVGNTSYTGVEDLFASPTPQSRSRKSLNTSSNAGSPALQTSTPHTLYSDIPDTPNGPGEMIVSPLSSRKPSGRKSMKSPKLSGVKGLFSKSKTPKMNLEGVKRVLSSPKENESPKLSGVKGLFLKSKTPKIKLDGVKRVLKSPPKKESPKLSGVKRLFLKSKTPKINLEGVKRVLSSPKKKNDILKDFKGMKRIMNTPKRRVKNTAVSPSGVDSLFASPPKSQKKSTPKKAASSKKAVSPRVDSEKVASPEITPKKTSSRKTKKATAVKGSSPKVSIEKAISPKARKATRGKKASTKTISPKKASTPKKLKTQGNEFKADVAPLKTQKSPAEPVRRKTRNNKVTSPEAKSASPPKATKTSRARKNAPQKASPKKAPTPKKLAKQVDSSDDVALPVKQVGRGTRKSKVVTPVKKSEKPVKTGRANKSNSAKNSPDKARSSKKLDTEVVVKSPTKTPAKQTGRKTRRNKVASPVKKSPSPKSPLKQTRGRRGKPTVDVQEPPTKRGVQKRLLDSSSEKEKTKPGKVAKKEVASESPVKPTNKGRTTRGRKAATKAASPAKTVKSPAKTIKSPQSTVKQTRGRKAKTAPTAVDVQEPPTQRGSRKRLLDVSAEEQAKPGKVAKKEIATKSPVKPTNKGRTTRGRKAATKAASPAKTVKSPAKTAPRKTRQRK